jgi:hypothetical protein
VNDLVRSRDIRGASARHKETLARLCSQRLGRKLRSRAAVGEAHMQSAQPRDIGVLVLVIGVFLILFIVTLTMGTPVR